MTAFAHRVGGGAAPQLDWPELLGVLLPLGLAAALYTMGSWRLRGRSHGGQSVRMRQGAAFFAGWLALIIALLSPIDTLGAQLFSIHMIQHEVMMIVAAPLLVLGRPLPIFLWAFPTRMRGALARWTQTAAIAGLWNGIRRPTIAWALHALVLWAWHAPALFEATLTNRGIHDLQHLSFVGTALLFWSALFHARSRDSQGAAILFLFTTTVHTSVLGALITFGSHPWYPAYLHTAPLWGLSAIEDQQLGGLIMWVPGSLVYVAVALALLARWLNAPSRSRLSRVV